MTATNAFTQGGKAYILTDGAEFAHNGGAILKIRSKVEVSRRWRLAVGMAGQHIGEQVRFALDLAKSQEDALQLLPQTAQIWRDRCAQAFGYDPYNIVRLWAAAYSTERKRPEVWYLEAGPDGKAPELRRIADAVSPLPVDIPRTELNDPQAFVIRRDAVPLLEAQRRVLVDGTSRAAGFVELVRVGRWGVRRSILHRWPDVIGRPVSLPT